MSAFVGYNFEKQRMTPNAYGRTLENTFTDGILNGAVMSYSGTTFTVTEGYLIIAGRQIQFPASTTFIIDQATSGYARIVLTIDLSKTATKTTFEQVSTRIEYSSTLAGFTSLPKNDINGYGSIYEKVLAVVALGTGGITGISSTLEETQINIRDGGVKTSHLGARIITAAKVALKALTRELLAEDALSSPMVYPNNKSYTLVAADLGKTLMIANSAATAADTVKYTIADSFGNALAVGAEVAFIRRISPDTQISFTDKQYSALPGETGFSLNRTYKIKDNYGFVVIKKINYGANQSHWLVLGGVEVV